jgi:hypothetical protein
MPVVLKMVNEEIALRAHLATHPQDWDSSIRLGSLLLRRGDYAAGWHYLYAAPKKYLPPANGQPPWLWRGESFQGKILLVFPNEGFGDLIQFFPLVQHLAQVDSKVIFQVPRVLHRLFANSANEHLRVLVWEDQSDDKEGHGADFYCSISCLPALVALSPPQLPLERRYLHAHPADVRNWAFRLGSSADIKVGVAWKGNPKHVRDHLRSMPIAAMQRLWDLPCQFYSLQVGTPSPSPQRLLDWTGDLHDFADTAAFLQCLDFVLTVDTAVAHLACALGIPTFILLDAESDWRWGTDAVTTPWYESARLFRQSAPGDWDGLMHTVTRTLQARFGR